MTPSPTTVDAHLRGYLILRTLSFLTLVAILTSAGCSPWWSDVGGVRIWAVPDTVTVFPDTMPEPENAVYSGASRTIRLEAAVNEVVSFQLVFRSMDGVSSIGNITVDDLAHSKQTIPAHRVQLYRQLRIPVNDYPAWYLRLTPHLRQTRVFPDPLVPLTAPRGALPIELTPAHCAAIWGEIRVPPGTEPTIYRSTITVSFDSGLTQRLRLVLKVWPFALPQMPHVDAVVGLQLQQLLRHHLEVDGQPYAPAQLSPDDPAYARATAILDNTLRLLHDHRCSPMLTDLKPNRQINGDGTSSLDWIDYDRLVSGALDGHAFDDRVPVAAWPIPVSDRNPSPELNGGWASPQYERTLVDYLRSCANHFHQEQWLDRHYVCLPVPGTTRRAQYEQFKRLGELVKQADPRLRLVCDLPPQSMTPWGWLEDGYRDMSQGVAIWAPSAAFLDMKSLAKERQKGKLTWFTPSRPPYSGSLALFAPPDHARSMAWQAYRFGCQGILIPQIDNWPETHGSATTRLTTHIATNEDTERTLIWPGKPYGLDHPIPSIRLKRLLRGLQDYEYLWLLERNRRPAIAALIAADIFPFGGTDCYVEHFLDGRAAGWVSDPAAWSLVGHLTAREIIAATKNRDATGLETSLALRASAETNDAIATEHFKQQVEWARYAQAVRQLHAGIEGIRVRFDTRDPKFPVHVEATVSLFNATRKPHTGKLAFVTPNEDWRGDDTTKPIQDLAPLQPARRYVRARTTTIHADVNGVLPLQIAFSGHQDEPQIIPGRLCVLTSQRRKNPIQIDGKLDDWPLGAGNVASDFVLVGALDVPKQKRPSPDRASQPTIVSVCNDSEFLYIAFSCHDDQLAQRRVTASNYVRYDDLWPVGDDLVEVILDPTGKAVVPGDVFHVVVKANGAVITEKGVPCLRKVAPHASGAAGVIAAVDDQTQPNRWTVEVRIPLASLGQIAPVLGVNFARFQSRLGEYASWSGAQRYLYTPIALGNMRLAP